MSHIVLMCYAHGYGKSGNCPTLGYIALILYVEVVIGLIFEGLNEEIMFTYNRQH
jgi:hypothetical protein